MAAEHRCADWRQMGENCHFSLGWVTLLLWFYLKQTWSRGVLGQVEDIQLGWAGTRAASTASLPWWGPERTQPGRQGFWRDFSVFAGRLQSLAVSRALLWQAAGRLCPAMGNVFSPQPSTADPSSARQPICVWSWCPRSDCFGLFISCSRLCCLLPPRANRFAKLPRYTNFVWQLTSLADEFCHHPSPELISLPVLQS